MPDLADLFPGYASEWINTSSGRIFARVGGKGPPLLLLHGFSSTHVMWHLVAPQLADKFTLIIADLPGYGWSDMPASDALHIPYSKRAMAKAMVEAMEQLGHVHFALIKQRQDKLLARRQQPVGQTQLLLRLGGDRQHHLRHGIERRNLRRAAALHIAGGTARDNRWPC